jgi:hypothetical protein
MKAVNEPVRYRSADKPSPSKKLAKSLVKMVPTVGIEPTTY